MRRLVNMGQSPFRAVSPQFKIAGIVPLLYRWGPEALDRQPPLIPGYFTVKPSLMRNKNNFHGLFRSSRALVFCIFPHFTKKIPEKKIYLTDIFKNLRKLLLG